MAGVTPRHDQCPVNMRVDTKSTDTVAVAVKADGRSIMTQQHHLLRVTSAPQRSHVAVAMIDIQSIDRSI